MGDAAVQQTERAFMQAVLDYARLTGWKSFHPFDSRRSTAGYPDLTLCRRGRIVFAELKTETGRVSPHQRGWIAELEQVEGIEVYVWRPGSWPEIEEVLR